MKELNPNMPLPEVDSDSSSGGSIRPLSDDLYQRMVNNLNADKEKREQDAAKRKADHDATVASQAFLDYRSGFQTIDELPLALRNFFEKAGAADWSSAEIMQMLLMMASNKNIHPEMVEQLVNLANYYQTLDLRDNDRAYNSASSQMSRLMATGMSRQAAIASIAQIPSEAQPTPATSEKAGVSRQLDQQAAQMAITAATSFVGAGSQLASTIQTIHNVSEYFPVQMQMAHTEADKLALQKNQMQYEIDGRDAANSFYQAAYSADHDYFVKHGFHLISPDSSWESLQDIINKGAEAGNADCIAYNGYWRRVTDGNQYAQRQIRHHLADSSTDDAVIRYTGQIYKNNALNGMAQYNNAMISGQKMQHEMDLIDAQNKTQSYLQKQLAAQTNLAVSQDEGQWIANRISELDYEVKTDWSAYECALYSGQAEVLLSAYDSGYLEAEASRIANDSKFLSFMSGQRYQYICDPEQYIKDHEESSKWLLRLVQDQTGSLQAVQNYWNATIANKEAQYIGSPVFYAEKAIHSVAEAVGAVGSVMVGKGVLRNSETAAASQQQQALGIMYGYGYARQPYQPNETMGFH